MAQAKKGKPFQLGTLEHTCQGEECNVGEIVQFYGEGYDYGQAMLKINNLWSAVPVAEDGTVQFAWNYFQFPGEYLVELYQNQGNQFILKGMTTVNVVA